MPPPPTPETTSVSWDQDPSGPMEPVSLESFTEVELQQFDAALYIILAMLRGEVGSHETLYAAVCHVATVLLTRPVAPVHWRVALDIFVRTERIWANIHEAEREHLRVCISMAREHLRIIESEAAAMDANNADAGNPSTEPGNVDVDSYMAEVGRTIHDVLSQIQQSSQTTDGASQQQEIPEIVIPPPKAPPASKEAYENMPTIIVMDEIQCAICLDNMTIRCSVLEMPCKHRFHASCLNPWLGNSNSCPLCRYELTTDDVAYEMWRQSVRQG